MSDSLQMIFGCEMARFVDLLGWDMANVAPAGIGAAYGTAKSGIGIAGVGTFRPDLIMKVNGLFPARGFRNDAHSTSAASP